jgi:hypothetical protein
MNVFPYIFNCKLNFYYKNFLLNKLEILLKTKFN